MFVCFNTYSTSLGQDILITQGGTKYDGKMLEVRHDKNRISS